MNVNAWFKRFVLSCLAFLFLANTCQSQTSETSKSVYNKPAVNPFLNIEEFPTVSARYVRFHIYRCSSRTPGFDEIEVFTDELIPRNVALIENGATYTASSTVPARGAYEPQNLGDGHFGRRHSWTALSSTNEWVEITLAKTERINRVVWSVDRTGNAWDRVTVDYRIDVSEHQGDWKTVASSEGRRPGLAFPEVTLALSKASNPSLKNEFMLPPVNSYHNEDIFPPIHTREIRFTILKSYGEKVKMDEIEIYSPNDPKTNLAQASNGSVAIASLDNDASDTSNQSITALIDGIYGNAHSWSQDLNTGQSFKIRLAESSFINRVVWSRDRTGKQFDGTPLQYRIEAADDRGEWKLIASSNDRQQLGTLQIAQETIQPSEYLIDSWLATEERPLNEARALAQTSDGYLWIGTDHGLLRFDGNRFTQFNRNNTPELSTPRIDYLHVDGKGRLWMTNQKFFYDANNNLVVYEKGRFNRVELPNGYKFHQLLEEESGAIWLQTDRGAIPWEAGKLHRERELPQLSLTSLQYRVYPRDPTTAVDWKAVIGKWVKGDFVSRFGLDGYPLSEVVNGNWGKQFGRRDGGAWIVNINPIQNTHTNRSHWRLLDSDGSLVKVQDFPWEGTHRTHMFVDSADNLWVAPQDIGLFRIFANGRQYEKIPDLNHLRVRRLFEDRDGDLWITTYTQGLKRLRKRLIKSIGLNQGMQVQQQGALPENVYSIAPARSGGIWIGTHASGAYLWQNGQLSSLLNAYSHTWSITEDQFGTIWTAGYGQYARRHSGDRVNHLPTVSTHPFSFLEGEQGRFWVGGDFGLSFVENDRLHRYVPPFFAKDKFEWVNSLLETPDGACWLGTKRGYLHRFKDEIFETYWKPDKGEEYPVSALYLNESNHIWMARYGFGLTRFKDGTFSHFTPKQGLPTSTINGILKDRDGFLWITSKAGVYRISQLDFERFAQGQLSDIRWQHFTVKNGLPSNTCQGEQNQPSLCQTPDGRIWIPTLKGIGVIDPQTLEQERRRPVVLIQDLTLYTDEGNNDELLYEATHHPEHGTDKPLVQIPPGNHSLVIRYTAIDFTEPSKVHFRYRIVGWDDNWVDAKNERSALIASLGHGKYRFEVMAIDHLGNESVVASLPLAVLPFWWETPAFRGALVFSFLALGGILYKYRVQQLEQRNQLQTEFSRQLIEREENERKRISQELHDSLGHELLIVRNRALDGINRSSTPDTQKQFESISEMAARALENTRGIAYNLRPFELDRIGFKKTIETMMTKISEGSETRYFKDIDDLEEVLPHTALVYLYRLLQEGLNNILKHAKASVVMLEVKSHKDYVHIQMSDNGVGFDPSHIRKGLGLAGMEERTRLIGGAFKISSNPGEGTQLAIRIPTKHSDKPPPP